MWTWSRSAHDAEHKLYLARAVCFVVQAHHHVQALAIWTKKTSMVRRQARFVRRWTASTRHVT
jgi:hypothetical protein